MTDTNKQRADEIMQVQRENAPPMINVGPWVEVCADCRGTGCEHCDNVGYLNRFGSGLVTRTDNG